MNYVMPKIDKMLHGGDYNPEQWLDRPDILNEDIELMKKANVNVVTLGVFSWSVYEPVEGEFNFQWLLNIMDNLYENGIYAILGTPSGARPAWLDEKYPEAMRVAKNGVRNHHGLRHNFCMSSPKYREKIAILDTHLANNFGSHKGLILWHISNELGGECYCNHCKHRFQEFLRNKYENDIKELNQQWWTTFWSHQYQSFEQIEPPYQNGETTIHGLNLDWKRFTTWNMTDFMKSEIEILKKNVLEVPVTTNFMRLYNGLDYYEMAKEIDIISWDSYPAWNNDYESLSKTAFDTAFDHGVMRSFKRDKPFLLMESTPSQVNWHPFNKLKRPEIHKLSCIQATACGADMIGYFQWRKGRGSFEQYHGAVLDHLGRSDTRVFRDVTEVGELLKKMEPVTGSLLKSEVGMIFDWNNRWAIEDLAGLSKNKKYEDTCRNQYEIFLRNGIEMDIISQEADFSEYKLLVLPMLYLIKPGYSNRLKDYVKKGGTVIATYLTGYVNENTLCHLGGFPGDGLQELFGLYIEEIDSLYPNDSNGVSILMNSHQSSVTFSVSDFCDIIKPQDATVIGRYTKDFYAGTPALTVNSYGDGMAYYVGARMDEKGMEYLYQKIWKEIGITPKQLPEGIEYHVRSNEEDTFEFYLNYTNEVKNIMDISEGTNLITGEKISQELSINPYDVTVIKLTNTEK